MNYRIVSLYFFELVSWISMFIVLLTMVFGAIDSEWMTWGSVVLFMFSGIWFSSLLSVENKRDDARLFKSITEVINYNREQRDANRAKANTR